MLHKAKALKNYTLHSLDGEIGKVLEFYFDDQHWTIRYLIVDTGHWLANRQVLISPYALGTVMTDAQQIAIHLTKQQIEESPSLDSDKPVSRQFEESYHEYYGWPMYWGGPYAWGFYPYPIVKDNWHASTNELPAGDPHLRSTHEVTGYHVHATDGDLGHIEDFIIDDESWAIRYLVIDTQNVWPGKKVLVSPRWIDHVSWSEGKVFITLSRETIKQSPEYHDALQLTRDYETELHGHYNRQGYWVDETVVKEE
jgi:uncharacterized protein YrrD